MSTVMLTGAAGFVGSHIADHLLASGHTVIAVDDLSGGFVGNLPSHKNLIPRVGPEWSINNIGQMELLFEIYKPGYVIHAAAYAAENLSHFIRRFNYQNNLIGSINLINAAVRHNVRGFVFLSSIAVYGHGCPPFVESSYETPADPYGISKLAVEMDLKAASAMFGLPYLIFRPFNIYGPRQNIADRFRNVAGIFFNQAMRGEPMTIFGSGEQTRAFSYIDDVAPGIAQSIDRKIWGQVINIGGGMPYSVCRLAREISKSMDVPLRVQYLPARNEAVDAFCDTTRAHYFGFMPKSSSDSTPLAAGIAKMAAWAKEFGHREPTKFHGKVEISKNMPESWKAFTES